MSPVPAGRAAGGGLTGRGFSRRGFSGRGFTAGVVVGHPAGAGRGPAGRATGTRSEVAP